VSIARWNLKEAEGKALARRTGIAYKAVAVGKKAIIFKAQYLHGNCGRRCGGHKCEGRVHYPGRSVYLPLATAVVRRRDGWTEVSRGHSRLLDQQLKGQTRKTDWEPCTSMTAGVADRRREMFFPTGEGSGQYPREYPAGATKVTAVQANFHEGPTWI
jgi:hypothetical protein